MKTRFASFSFGCRVNEAERQRFDRQLQQAGFAYSEKCPDFFIINTCAVTQKAEREARQLIYRLKKKHPSLKIFITGCAATHWLQDGLWRDLPVEKAIHNEEKDGFPDYIKRVFKPVRATQGNIAIRNKFLDSGRMLVKIQDGCNRRCSYCIVPLVRGLPRSYPISQIIETVNSRARNIKEVVLTAINTEAYGLGTDETLSGLVKDLMRKTDIQRISFGSINPWSVTPDFLEAYKNFGKTGRLAVFFHIPLQSGSDTILRRMKRGYTAEEFSRKLEMVRKLDRFAFIATDVIVGFLGETEKEFEETYRFLENSPISRFHIFKYSMRNHTSAEQLAKEFAEPTNEQKTDRARRLAVLGKRKYETFLKKHLGRRFSALFLEKREGGYQSALLSNQIPVKIQSCADFKGKIREVEIVEYKKGVLFGKIPLSD